MVSLTISFVLVLDISSDMKFYEMFPVKCTTIYVPLNLPKLKEFQPTG